MRLTSSTEGRVWACAVGAVLGLGAIGHAAPAAPEEVGAFLGKHCAACHGAKKAKGKFRVDRLTPDFNDKANRERWRSVRAQLQAGAMPPKGKPRPPEKELQFLHKWIDGRFAAAEAARRATQGRTALRRLNQIEYQNTVRDLLEVDVDLKDLLPVDTSANGFDTTADALHISSFLMEQYLETAERALNTAIANGPRPNAIKKRFSLKDERSVKAKGSVYRHLDDAVAIFSSWVSANIQVNLWQFQARDRGRYRFRISAYAMQSSGKPVIFHAMTGKGGSIANENDHFAGYFEAPAGKPAVVEFVERLEPRNTLRIITDRLGVTPPTVQRVGAENYKGPGLAVQWVEVEGPLLDSWPPPSHRRLFGDLVRIPAADNRNRLEVVSKNPKADAERILRNFTRRAFRRTVTDKDVKPFLARVQAKLADGYSFEQAMRVGLKSVLVSPEFLFHNEKPGRLDDFALACRLSYFLWSTMPDEELFSLAEQHQLRNPDTLRRQVERLLKDPKAAAFTEQFAGQWLGLRNIDATMPDPRLYPEFDNILKAAMVEETLRFFAEVLKDDLSVTHFVASDFSMLNGPLARHYGIPGVEGLRFRKVTLPAGSHRGGVLTMASVLKVTANGTTTSPVLRGAWVLDRILGTPPPKPTVDVEAVEPDIRGATTIREQLAKHRARAECASCHAKIDPPGFALESFDVIGGWRDHYRSVGKGEAVIVNGRRMRYLRGAPVDAADLLPDGRRFGNIDEFKQLLLRDKDRLARSLTAKLVTYATGRAPEAADEPEIEAIVRKVRAKNYGMRMLMHEVVQSELFRNK